MWTCDAGQLAIAASKATFEKYDLDRKLHLLIRPCTSYVSKKAKARGTVAYIKPSSRFPETTDRTFDIIYVDARRARKTKYIVCVEIIPAMNLVAKNRIVLMDDSVLVYLSLLYGIRN